MTSQSFWDWLIRDTCGGPIINEKFQRAWSSYPMTLIAGYGQQLVKDKQWEELTMAEQVNREGGVEGVEVV